MRQQYINKKLELTALHFFSFFSLLCTFFCAFHLSSLSSTSFIFSFHSFSLLSSPPLLPIFLPILVSPLLLPPLFSSLLFSSLILSSFFPLLFPPLLFPPLLSSPLLFSSLLSYMPHHHHHHLGLKSPTPRAPSLFSPQLYTYPENDKTNVCIGLQAIEQILKNKKYRK